MIELLRADTRYVCDFLIFLQPAHFWPSLSQAQFKLCVGTCLAPSCKTCCLAGILTVERACVQVEDILKPNALDMLLFVLYLYQALPQLVPRATVEFMGRLQEKQVNLILGSVNQAPHEPQKFSVPCSLQHYGASGIQVQKLCCRTSAVAQVHLNTT